MNAVPCILTIGGDARLRTASAGFAAVGRIARDYPAAKLDDLTLCAALERAQAIVLPIPVLAERGLIAGTELPLEAVLARAGPDCMIFAGRPPAGLARTVMDYSAAEAFQAANAIPTAEGAIQILMETLPITLCGARALVIGYGRIGKALASRLQALGACCTVCARKAADFAVIEAASMRADQTGVYRHGLRYDCIINTVPAMVLNAQQVAQTEPDCFLLDLASQPGGIDFAACGTLGRRCRHALSLPGQVAPVTSGLIIRDVVASYLDQKG